MEEVQKVEERVKEEEEDVVEGKEEEEDETRGKNPADNVAGDVDDAGTTDEDVVGTVVESMDEAPVEASRGVTAEDGTSDGDGSDDEAIEDISEKAEGERVDEDVTGDDISENAELEETVDKNVEDWRCRRIPSTSEFVPEDGDNDDRAP